MTTLGNALNLHWAFGFSKDGLDSVQSLSASNRNALFFMSSHSGVIYDYENRTQTILQGHCNVISCCAVDSQKRWIVTADAGYDPIIVVWDALQFAPLKTFPSPHQYGVSAIDISNDGVFISTLSAHQSDQSATVDSAQELAIWAWTREDNEPIVKQRIAASEYHHTIKFNPANNSQIVTTGDKSICFWNWDELVLESYYGRASQKDLGKYTGHFVSTIFLPGTENAVTATSTGFVVIWEAQANPKTLDTMNSSAIRTATKVVRLVECGINILATTVNDYLAVACADGAVRFYDFFLRLEAWFEDLSAGPITSLSFSVQSCPYSAGEAGSPGLKFWCPDFLVGTSDAFVIGIESNLFDEVRKENRRGTLLMQGMADEITSLSTHPSQHLLAISSRSGVLQVWNYEMKLLLMLREFNVSKISAIDGVSRNSLLISCCSYDRTGSLIAVGFSNGIIRLLSSDSLEDFASYAPSSESIHELKFSPSGSYFAACDSSYHVMLFKREDRDEDLFALSTSPDRYVPSYVYLGRALAHSAKISGIEFGYKDGAETLISVAEDRYCVEYDLQLSSVVQGIQIVPTNTASVVNSKKSSMASHYIELIAKPTAVMWHPRIGDDIEDRFVYANDEFKFKELNLDSKQCRKTTLAPRFGAPVSKLLHIPRTRSCSSSSEPEILASEFYAFAADSRVIGVGAFPLTGSPNEVMGIVAHPKQISAIASTFDGKFLFSAGGLDLSVNMWELQLPDTTVFIEHPPDSMLEDLANKCPIGTSINLKPYLSLLEGGEEGDLHSDIVDYFYYCQLRSSSEDSMDQRNLPGNIPLEEIPSLFRSVGYYPSEVEVTNVINEIRYKKFMVTGETQDTVDLEEFIKLYVNHRPVLPLDHDYFMSAFKKVCHSVNSSEGTDSVLSWVKIKDLLTMHGERISGEDLSSYLSALIGGDESVVPESATYDAKEFAELFLGFEDFYA